MLHLYLAINYIKERLLAVSGASTEILEDLSKYMKNHLAVVLCASTEVLEDLRNMKNHLAVVLCASTEIRTPVLALKGLRPGPLDDGGINGKILPFPPESVKKK